MPAPAVIPAPKAYINAVAVKGFVVELRAVSRFFNQVRPTRTIGSATPDLAAREHNIQKETKNTGLVPISRPGARYHPFSCNHCDQPASKTGGGEGESSLGKHACHARRGAPVIFTVTKEV